jgi:hypothetical protein
MKDSWFNRKFYKTFDFWIGFALVVGDLSAIFFGPGLHLSMRSGFYIIGLLLGIFMIAQSMYVPGDGTNGQS